MFIAICHKVNELQMSNIIFNLDNLEPAPGRPAPELEVKALKIVKLDVLNQVVQIKK